MWSGESANTILPTLEIYVRFGIISKVKGLVSFDYFNKNLSRTIFTKAITEIDLKVLISRLYLYCSPLVILDLD